MSAQAIGKYERDEAMPRSPVLMALADALGVNVSYLVGDGWNEPSGRSLPGQERDRQARAGPRWGTGAQQTRAIPDDRGVTLDLPSVHWDRPRWAPYPVSNGLIEADRAAGNLRNDWGLGLNPIPDMGELMEDRGIKVFFCALADGIDGMTADVRREGLPDAHVIVIDQDVSRDRQRFYNRARSRPYDSRRLAWNG